MSNDKILAKYNLDPNKLFYTTKEICELIDRSNVLLTAYRSKGVLGDPVKLVAKKFMFDKATVEAFLIEFEDHKYNKQPRRNKSQQKKYQQLELLEVNDNESIT